MIKNKFYVLLLVVFFLQGCKDYNDDNALAIIQSGYAAINPEKNEAVCFYLGNVNFPYTYQENNPDWDKYNTWINNELGRRLNLFSELDLLHKSENDSGQQQYQLAAEGSQYYRDKYKGFCFGNFVFAKTQEPVAEYSASVKITYSYAIEAIPNWATNPIFIDYFYYGKNVKEQPNGNKIYYNRAEKYPYLTGETNQIGISFAKVADGSIVYGELFMPHLYAFYDRSVGRQTEYQKQQNIIIGWGVEDPILDAKKE